MNISLWLKLIQNELLTKYRNLYLCQETFLIFKVSYYIALNVQFTNVKN